MSTNKELLQRRSNAVPRGVATAMPFFAEKAENAELWDVEGKRYIDFAGGIGVLNTGHRHPKVMAAVREQLERFTHTCYQVMPYPGYVALAEPQRRLGEDLRDESGVVRSGLSHFDFHDRARA